MLSCDKALTIIVCGLLPQSGQNLNLHMKLFFMCEFGFFIFLKVKGELRCESKRS
jgi:hypothetical protein